MHFPVASLTTPLSSLHTLHSQTLPAASFLWDNVLLLVSSLPSFYHSKQLSTSPILQAAPPSLYSSLARIFSTSLFFCLHVTPFHFCSRMLTWTFSCLNISGETPGWPQEAQIGALEDAQGCHSSITGHTCGKKLKCEAESPSSGNCFIFNVTVCQPYYFEYFLPALERNLSHIQVLKIASLLQLSPQTIEDIHPSRGCFRDESIPAVSIVITCAGRSTSSLTCTEVSRGPLRTPFCPVAVAASEMDRFSDWKFGFWTMFSSSTHSASPSQWCFSFVFLSCILLGTNTGHHPASPRLDTNDFYLLFPLLPVSLVCSLPPIC